MLYLRRDVGTVGTRVAMLAPPPTSISEPNKVRKFQFETSGISLFTDVQKLYGPEILRFLPCMIQFLNNLWWLFIFSNYIGEIDQFTLDLQEGLILNAGNSERFLIVDHRKEGRNEQEFKR